MDKEQLIKVKIIKEATADEDRASFSTLPRLTSRNAKQTIWEKISKTCLYLLVFLAPLFFLPLTIAPVEINKQVFAGVLAIGGFICFLIYLLKERKVIYPKSLISLAVLILAAVWGLSALFSSAKTVSIWGNFVQPDSLASLLIYCLVFFLAAVNLRKENTRSLGIVFFIGLALTTIGGLAGILWPRLLGAGFNTIGSLLNFAVFEAFGLVMVVAALFGDSEIKRKTRVLLSLLGLLIVFQLILLNYSFIWWILIAALLVLAAYEFINANKLNIGLIILAGCFLFFILISPVLPSWVQLPVEIRPSFSSSWTVFKDSLNFKQLFLGNGPATFGYSYALHRPLALNQTDFWSFRFNQGFSFLLTVLTTTGILGILAILFLVLGFVWPLRKKQFSPPSFIVAAGVGFLFAAWLFAPLSFTQALFIFMGLGLLTALTDSIKEIPIAGLKKFSVFAIFILCMVLVMGSFWGLSAAGKKYAGAIYYAKGLSSINSQGNLDKGISQLDRARQLDPDSDQYFRALSQALFAKVGELAKQNASSGSAESGQAEIQNTIAATIQTAKQAAIINDNDYLNWDNLGSIYEGLIPLAADAVNLAEESYLKAIKLDPRNPQEPINLARSLVSASDIYGTKDASLKQEKLNKAKDYLESALKLKADYAPAHFLAAAISLREGKIEEAIGKLELAKQSALSDAGLAFQLGLLYYQNNQYDKAQAELERTININADYSNARYFLGLVYDQKGQKQKAIEQFERIEKLNPDNQEIKKILVNLRDGQPALKGVVPPAQPPVERVETPVPENGKEDKLKKP